MAAAKACRDVPLRSLGRFHRGDIRETSLRTPGGAYKLRSPNDSWFRRVFGGRELAPAYVQRANADARRCPECSAAYEPHERYCPRCHMATPEWRYG